MPQQSFKVKWAPSGCNVTTADVKSIRSYGLGRRRYLVLWAGASRRKPRFQSERRLAADAENAADLPRLDRSAACNGSDWSANPIMTNAGVKQVGDDVMKRLRKVADDNK